MPGFEFMLLLLYVRTDVTLKAKFETYFRMYEISFHNLGFPDL